MTPLKTQARQKNHPPRQQQQAQVSYYDSETPYHPPPTTRTNTNLNLSVLRRYVPSIAEILSIAKSTDLYTYSPALQAWERAEINGTMFVCKLQTIDNPEAYCIVVLNKKGLDNLIIGVADMLNVEITTEFLIVRFRDNEDEKVLGFFIHESEPGQREGNSKIIEECWQKVMGEQNDGGQSHAEVFEDFVDEERAPPVAGQRLSLTDLFGTR